MTLIEAFGVYRRPSAIGVGPVRLVFGAVLQAAHLRVIGLAHTSYFNTTTLSHSLFKITHHRHNGSRHEHFHPSSKHQAHTNVMSTHRKACPSPSTRSTRERSPAASPGTSSVSGHNQAWHTRNMKTSITTAMSRGMEDRHEFRLLLLLLLVVVIAMITLSSPLSSSSWHDRAASRPRGRLAHPGAALPAVLLRPRQEHPSGKGQDSFFCGLHVRISIMTLSRL
jgi:hypothetical protein